MAVKLGNGNWAVKEDKLLAYNDNSGLFFNKEFDFTRGSTATYVGRDGLIASAASGVPRIDFTNDTKGHLLLEPSRTNLIPYSEDFSSLDIRNNAVVTSNAILSPSGLLNADEITFDGTSLGRVQEAITVTNNQSYTISLYLKNKNLSDTTQVWIGFAGSFQGGYVTITDEWKRYDITTTSNNTTEYPRIQFDGTGSLYAWGFQVEEGDYSTSLINTTGAASTRNADVCNNSGSAQDFNSEEGVLYAEIGALADDGTNRLLSINDSTSSNSIWLYFNTSNSVTYSVRVGGVAQASASHTIDIKTFNKIAIKYKENDFAVWFNGVKTLTDTSGNTYTSGTLNNISFDAGDGALDFYGKVRNLQVFTEALTDEQLEKLTS